MSNEPIKYPPDIQEGLYYSRKELADAFRVSITYFSEKLKSENSPIRRRARLFSPNEVKLIISFMQQ